MTNTVTILGINGRIGQFTADAFVKAGWTVFGFGRTDRAKVPGVTFVEGDADNLEDIRRAIADAEVVVNTLNLPYEKWFNGRAEAQNARVAEAMKGTGKTLMFPGNIYNYAAGQHELTPQTPERPETERGAIRVRIEKNFRRAAEADGFQVLVIRAGDFYGPGARESWFDLSIARDFAKKTITYPGDPALGHTWAYLPDLGRAFVKLAEKRDQFGPFERFHFAGHFATGTEMIEAVQAALPEPFKVKPMPWRIMAALGVFVPVIREVVKMRYLWRHPHRLADPRLEAIVGEGTPFRRAVLETTQSYLARDNGAPVAGMPAAA